MFPSMASLKREVEDDLRERVSDEGLPVEEEDLFQEVVDSSIPVYTADLLKLALDDLSLATVEPDILAFDGTASAVNCIAGMVYSDLMEYARSVWDEIVEEHEEEEEEEEEEV